MGKITDFLKRFKAIFEDDKRRLGTDIETAHLQLMAKNAKEYYKKASRETDEFQTQYWLQMLKYNNPTLARRAAVGYFSKEIASKTKIDPDKIYFDAIKEHERKKEENLTNRDLADIALPISGVIKSPLDSVDDELWVLTLYSNMWKALKKDKRALFYLTYLLIKSRVNESVKHLLPFQKQVEKMIDKIEKNGDNPFRDTYFLKEMKMGVNKAARIKEVLAKEMSKIRKP